MRIKSKIKDNKNIVKVKLTYKELIDEEAVKGLKNKNIASCFLGIEKMTKRKLIYSGPQGISLDQYLNKTINKFNFYRLVEQILGIVKAAGSYELKLRDIVFDVKYMYINETTKTLYCIYVPIFSGRDLPDMLGFIRQIINRVNVEVDLEESIVMFSNFLENKAMNGFDINQIEKFISREDVEIAKMIACNNSKKSGFLPNKLKEYYEHYGDKNIEVDDGTGIMEAEIIEEKNGTGLMDTGNMEIEYGTGLMDTGNMEIEYGTGLMDTVDMKTELGTGMMDTGNMDIEYGNGGMIFGDMECPILKRISTSERIMIDKKVFLLGRNECKIDYSIDNKYVAHKHAEIIIRGERCFVNDLGGSNHTYINDNILYPNQEKEIKNGDILRLANEEFLFIWNR